MKNDAVAKLRLARKKSRLSQAELGKKAGYNEKTISRIERGEPCSTDALTHVAKALGLDPSEITDGSKELSVRRRSLEKVRRIRDGQECMRRLLECSSRDTRVDVQRDPDNEAVHAAIVAICEVVDLIRAHAKTPSEISTRAEYEGARDIGKAISTLEKAGWLLELEQREVEVHGADHDFELFWCVRIRCERVAQRASDRH